MLKGQKRQNDDFCKPITCSHLDQYLTDMFFVSAFVLTSSFWYKRSISCSPCRALKIKQCSPQDSAAKFSQFAVRSMWCSKRHVNNRMRFPQKCFFVPLSVGRDLLRCTMGALSDTLSIRDSGAFLQRGRRQAQRFHLRRTAPVRSNLRSSRCVHLVRVARVAGRRRTRHPAFGLARF